VIPSASLANSRSFAIEMVRTIYSTLLTRKFPCGNILRIILVLIVLTIESVRTDFRHLTGKDIWIRYYPMHEPGNCY